jgi:hypothetical protein
LGVVHEADNKKKKKNKFVENILRKKSYKRPWLYRAVVPLTLLLFSSASRRAQQ